MVFREPWFALFYKLPSWVVWAGPRVGGIGGHSAARHRHRPEHAPEGVRGTLNVEEPDRKKFIDAWVAYSEAKEGSADYKRNFWAEEAMWKFSRDKPELCWELILGILGRDLSDSAVANLAAGATEDLLATHGPDFIERVETRARQDRKFRHLLGGVWQNDMTDEIWERVKTAAVVQW